MIIIMSLKEAAYVTRAWTDGRQRRRQACEQEAGVAELDSEIIVLSVIFER